MKMNGNINKEGIPIRETGGLLEVRITLLTYNYNAINQQG
jgi:hypothetical protein